MVGKIVVLGFAGDIETIASTEYRPKHVVHYLQKQSGAIAEEIRCEIATVLDTSLLVDVRIDFFEGSVAFWGFISLIETTKPVVYESGYVEAVSQLAIQSIRKFFGQMISILGNGPAEILIPGSIRINVEKQSAVRSRPWGNQLTRIMSHLFHPGLSIIFGLLLLLFKYLGTAVDYLQNILNK
jgi:hypothetical protein